MAGAGPASTGTQCVPPNVSGTHLLVLGVDLGLGEWVPGSLTTLVPAKAGSSHPPHVLKALRIRKGPRGAGSRQALSGARLQHLFQNHLQDTWPPAAFMSPGSTVSLIGSRWLSAPLTRSAVTEHRHRLAACGKAPGTHSRC